MTPCLPLSADLRLSNLEAAIPLRGAPCPEKHIHYRMHPLNLACLTAARLDRCTLANNHVLDWGVAGLEDTLAPLAQGALIAIHAEQDGRGGLSFAMQLRSPAFAHEKHIPVKHTCDGANVSPLLRWSHAPDTTKSFALICEDPDAPAHVWTHWLIYNLPATTGELPEHVPPAEALPSGALQGVNDFNRIGYGGPCPPAGQPHHYHFKLYALDSTLRLPPAATKLALQRALAGHVLAETQLVGLYQRGG